LSQGQRPRLFLDMVAFIEMGRDSRTYRFFQDTLHGRVLIAEGQQIDRIVAAVTNYVARRLVERERTLVAESACREAAGGNGSPSEARRENAERAGPPAPERRQRAFPSASPSAEAASPAEAEALKVAIAPAPLGRRLIRGIGAALRFVVMTLGSLTLIGLLAVAGYVAWTIWLHNLLARWTGASTL